MQGFSLKSTGLSVHLKLEVDFEGSSLVNKVGKSEGVYANSIEEYAKSKIPG